MARARASATSTLTITLTLTLPLPLTLTLTLTQPLTLPLTPNPDPNPNPYPNPNPNPDPNPNQDDTPGGEAASGYSLSFGPLRSPTPTGAGGLPFGAAGAGRGLRVLFSLSTAARDTVGLGRCEDEDDDATPN